MTRSGSQPRVSSLPTTSGSEARAVPGTVALVHEWLSARTGSEQVFEQLASTFPSADLYALTADPEVPFDFGHRRVQTSALDKLGPFREARHLTLPLMPAAWKCFRRPSYDAVVTSTHAFGRGFVRPSDGAHFNYVHAPMRYVWTPELDPRLVESPVGGVAVRRVLQKIDRRSVSSVDSFAANSTAVAGRIGQFYGRHAEVIHPPVDTEFFSDVIAEDDGYLLSLSRLIPYKRHDLAIMVGAKLDTRVVIAGAGPEEYSLRQLAERIHPGGVDFVIEPSREQVRSLMARASALVFGAHEDLGMVAIEAQATGTPVVGLGAGGTLDTVVEGQSGTLAAEQSADAFTDATQRCLDLAISPEACRSNAEKFSISRFRSAVLDWVSTRG